MLCKVTFTGVDQKTDVERLARLATEYPKVEFGLLATGEHAQRGNRFFDPAMLCALRGKGLPLSLHVCGRFNKELLQTGDWGEVRQFVGDELSLFDRVQLNVSTRRMRNYAWNLTVPPEVSEVIIQQSSVKDSWLYRQYLEVSQEGRDLGRFVMLLDASGGHGVFLGSPVVTGLPYVGYAGGIGPDNVCSVVEAIENNHSIFDYWIDMEAGVRDAEDWFSLDACEQVLIALRGRGFL